MLIDASVTIAYKCSSCGSFEFFSVSFFKLLHSRNYDLSCRCGKSKLTITKEGTRHYRIRIPCIGCGCGHSYVLNRRELLYKEINEFYCPDTGIKQCFAGTDDRVRKNVDKLEKEFDSIIDMFGYDNYFKNTQVMFDSLNKVHDIAEKGNLYCECGSGKIEIVLFSDKIHLECKRCHGSKTIYAFSNENLKSILKSRKIKLIRRCVGYGFRDTGNLVSKTDRKQ